MGNNKEMVANDEQYERLTSLAKKEYEKRIKELDISEIDELLYESQEYIFKGVDDKQKYIAKKIFKPVVRQYTEDIDKWNKYIEEACELSHPIQVEVNGADKELVDRIVGPKDAAGDLLKMTVYPTETEEIVVYGYTQNAKSKLDVIGKKHPDINIVDLSYFFAGIFLYKKLIKELQRLQRLTQEEREQDYHYKETIKFFEENLERVPNAFDKNSEEARIYCEEYISNAKEYKRKNPRNKRVTYNIFKTAKQVSRSMYEYHIFGYYTFQRMLKGEISLHRYCDFIDYSEEEGKGWRALLGGFSPFVFYNVLLYRAEEAKGSVVANYRSYKGMESEYAKSFMTKKNQSEKLKARIKDSLFWKYFGYVEYDEEIDYSAIEQYEKEFEEFYQKYFPQLNLSGNAIRFRKLGQHHAAGLYYPHMKCLCVDIGYPGSFIHELGHLIDYEYGNLSSKPDFARIREATLEYLTECRDEGNALGKQLKSKNKYNLFYYLTPTEIFARSFELYVYYVWGQRDSLLEEKYDGVYDCSEENIQRVKDYFDKVLKNT